MAHPREDVPALRPPLVDPMAHRGLTPPRDPSGCCYGATGQPAGRPSKSQPETVKPLPPSGLAKFPSLQWVLSNPADHASPSAIAGKTLTGTPSTRNLVIGVGAVEGVSYGDGVARVGLTRGEVYHQLEKANINRLQQKQTAA